jgi:hypothetical protein
MKRSFTSIFFLLLAFCLQAQITIEPSDYTLQADVPIKGWRMATTGVTPPEEGADVTWDFSTQALTGPFDYVKNTANDPDFPDANLTDATLITQLGLVPQPVTFFERLDDSGYATLGRKTEEIRVPSQSITGGPNDTITFLAKTNIYEEENYFFKFPLNYQDVTGYDITIEVDFEITVAAFGLDHVPAKQIAFISSTDSVVGYGTLILPHPDGTGSVSMEALLTRDERMTVDSFYLAGQPAPQVMLDALGLTQGGVSQRTQYVFYAKGLSRSALNMTFNDGDISISMSDDIRDLLSSTKKVDLGLQPTEVFPNPTTGSFQVAFDKSDAHDWTFTLYNPLGQLALQQKIGGGSGPTQAELHLPARSPGIYHFLLRNGEGMVVGSGKLQVQ